MNARAKGLIYRNEVRHILEDNGYQVYTPPPRPKWIGSKQILVHDDIFGYGDLLTLKDGQLLMHQVTTLDNKASHANKIGDAPCWLWCRLKGKKRYRVFLNGMEVMAMAIGDYE